MTKEELDTEIREYLRGGGKLYLVEGIFEGGSYIKSPIFTENGLEYEVFGCTYKWKFITDRNFIDSIATVKRVLVEILKLLSKFPPLVVFWRHFVDMFLEVYEADLKKKFPKDFELPQPHRELYRAGVLFFNKDLVSCMVSFLYDTAYCFRLQDLFGELVKENVRKDVKKEVLRVIDIGLSRENDLVGVKSVYKKVKIIKRIISLALSIPRFRSMVRDFLLEVDLAKVRFSEADRYFALDRMGYDYLGLPLDFRKEIKKDIDLEKGHAILNL